MHMKMYEYKDQMVTINELSEISGIAPATIRDRIRRGYTVEEAVQIVPTNVGVREFCESSWYEDWIGVSTKYLHTIYWKWCIEHGYEPLNQQAMTRQILKMYPQLKTVPTRLDTGCCRIIRER